MKLKLRQNFILLSAALAIMVAGINANSHAASWSATGTADWFVPGNWLGGTVPVASDFAYITNGGTAVINSGSAYATSVIIGDGYDEKGSLLVGTSAKFFTAGGSTDYINKGSVTVYGLHRSENYLVVGSGTGLGSLAIGVSGSVVTNSNGASIGSSSNSFGTVTVDGFWQSDNLPSGQSSAVSLSVGYSGTGVLIINATGTVKTGRNGSRLGAEATGVGSVIVNGLWDNEGGVTVGGLGSGTINIGVTGTVLSREVTLGMTNYTNFGTGVLIVSGFLKIDNNTNTGLGMGGGGGTLVVQDNAVIRSHNISMNSMESYIYTAKNTIRITGTDFQLTKLDGSTPLEVIGNRGDNKIIFDHHGFVDFVNPMSGETLAVQLVSGTTALRAANNYKGDTVINNGATLLVANASALGTGNVAVSVGGVLDLFGSGTIGTLVVRGNFSSLGELQMTLAADGHADLFSVAGNITIGGILRLDPLDTIDYDKQYQLFKDFSNLTVSGLDITGYDTANWSAEFDGLGWLHFAAIPEPSTWVLTVMGLLMIVLMVRILSLKTTKNNK